MVQNRCLLMICFMATQIMLCTSFAIEGSQENCMISLVIPKEHIKTSCDGANYHTSQKIRSVENYLALIRKDISELQLQATTVIAESMDKKLEDIANRMSNLEVSVIPRLEKQMDNIVSSQNQHEKDNEKNCVSKKNVIKMMKSILKKKWAKIKEERQEETYSQLKYMITKEVANQMKEYTRRAEAFARGIGAEVLLNNEATANTFDSLHSSNKRHHTDEESQQKWKKAHLKNFETSAVFNEFPEDSYERLEQSDYTNELDLAKTLNKFKHELTKNISEQSDKVHFNVNQYLNLVESKLAKVMNSTEEMKHNLQQYISNTTEHLKNESIKERFQKLENKIEIIAKGTAALKDYLITDLSGNKELQQNISTFISDSKLYKSDIEFIKEQLQVDKKLLMSVRSTVFEILKFNGDMRVTSYLMEQNLTQITQHLKALNASINVDYENNFDLEETINKLDIRDSVKFVKKVRDIWPSLLKNLTSIKSLHLHDMENVIQNFAAVKNDVTTFRGNLTYIIDKIELVQNEIRKVTESVEEMEHKARLKALTNNEWIKYNFNYTFGRSECHGNKKYVKTTGYSTGKYVGVLLCSPTKYKIFLSDSLEDDFMNIGDPHKFGEDHCEFVGADLNATVTVGKAAHQLENIPGYRRGDWGQVPVRGTLSFLTPSPPWYECGITIP